MPRIFAKRWRDMAQHLGRRAVVELEGRRIGEATCDTFGEFVIDALETGKEYRVTLAAEDHDIVEVCAFLAGAILIFPNAIRRDTK